MNVALTYPIPFNLLSHYRENIRKFTETFKAFPPGCDYHLYVTCHWGQPNDAMRAMFYDMRAEFVDGFYGDHCDIGSTQQIIMFGRTACEFVVGLTTHNYFHREGWLKRLVEAREKYGPGLYGASASFEGRPHIRTAGYGLDTKLWNRYPHAITNRHECSRFENGNWSITEFVRELNLPAMQVTWDGEQLIDDWRTPAGIFRRGEQNAMLLYDRHSDIYRDATDDEKSRLEKVTDGLPDSHEDLRS